jgi:hypothetical protein
MNMIYKLVPIEPTEEMVLNAINTFGGVMGTPENLANHDYVNRILDRQKKAVIGHYKAMLEASPPTDTLPKSVEQKLRDVLERMGIDDAQKLTSGDLVELANWVSGIHPSDTQREFEKWHRETYGDKPSFNRDHEGSSRWDGDKANRFEAWQAALAHSQKDANTQRMNYLSNGGWEVLQDPKYWTDGLTLEQVIDRNIEAITNRKDE